MKHWDTLGICCNLLVFLAPMLPLQCDALTVTMVILDACRQTIGPFHVAGNQYQKQDRQGEKRNSGDV